MKFIKRIEVTDASLVSTGALENQWWDGTTLQTVPAWNSTANWTAGALVWYGRKVYKAATTHTGSVVPPLAPAVWVFQGATNKWAPFDDAVGSQAVVQGAGTNTLEYTLTPGERFDSFGVLGMAGSELGVEIFIPGSNNLQPYGVRTLPAGVWADVSYGNAFLAVGATGGAHSVDGATWTARSMPNKPWQSVSYGNGFWLASNKIEPLAFQAVSLPVITSLRRLVHGSGIWVGLKTSASEVDYKPLRSTDGGLTFTAATTDIGGSSYGTAYGGGAFALLGSLGPFWVSTDGGITYTSRTPPELPALSSWENILHDGSGFVLMGINGTLKKTVDNGLNWTTPTSLSAGAGWTHMSHNAGVYIALSASGSVGVSTDLTSWTYKSLPSFQQYKKVIPTPTGFAILSEKAIYTSTDNFATYATWPFTLDSSDQLIDIVYADGLYHVVVFYTLNAERHAVFASTNLTNWFLVPSSSDAVELAYANGVLLAPKYYSNTISRASTTNLFPVFAKETAPGVWTETTLPFDFSANSRKLAASPTHHVAVSPGQISYTTNGTAFTHLPIAGNWRDVDYVGNRFIAVSQGSSLAYATSPTSWTTVNLASEQAWSGSAFGAGRYVVISEGGKIAVSTDGQNFITLDIQNIGAKSISFGGGLFVIVGNEKALTSLDGITWTEKLNSGLGGYNWISSSYASVGGIDTFVALASNKAASAVMASSIYSAVIPLIEDEEPVVDMWSYFFTGIKQKTDLIVTDLETRGYSNAVLKVTIKGLNGAPAKLGVLSYGVLFDVGDVEHGVTAGITNYSTYDVDAFGVTRITPRTFAKRVNVKAIVPKERFNSVFEALTAYKDIPVISMVSRDEAYSTLTVYGHIREWGGEIAYPTVTYFPIEIRGLT